jgi:hypothetical protein
MSPLDALVFLNSLREQLLHVEQHATSSSSGGSSKTTTARPSNGALRQPVHEHTHEDDDDHPPTLREAFMESLLPAQSHSRNESLLSSGTFSNKSSFSLDDGAPPSKPAAAAAAAAAPAPAPAPAVTTGAPGAAGVEQADDAEEDSVGFI